ncbi:MAG: four helix bundle protein [Proteobacteria bacterium]|nr:four helix bundle protein [Pseudomonadota bacterium]MBU1545552.1 four helix bundle protein [Pseudomonadota bacterium]MBU2619875.1 four helix bundle protein [Pseudomonadota bacterium]
MSNFRELAVWEKAHVLAVQIYKISQSFPKTELYGPTSQMRRACVSIPANIAEGCGRGSDADFARFVYIAMGSACELEYHLLLACELEFLEKKAADSVIAGLSEIKKMLSGLIKKLKTDNRKLSAGSL